MKLKVITEDESQEIIKITAHQNGKSGFSSGAVKQINLTKDCYIQIAKDEDNPKDDSLYMIVHREDVPKALKVNKSGKYYSIRTKKLYDKLGIDYKNKKIIFDIEEIVHDQKTIYKLNRRDLGLRKKSK